MKAWRLEQAQRDNVSPSAIVNRLARGWYAGKIRIKRINPRVVFVIEGTGGRPKRITA